MPFSRSENNWHKIKRKGRGLIESRPFLFNLLVRHYICKLKTRTRIAAVTMSCNWAQGLAFISYGGRHVAGKAGGGFNSYRVARFWGKRIIQF